MRIVFAGTPEFALASLEAIANSRHELVGVVTQPDRAAGRGQRLAASPVKTRALALGVPVIQPPGLKKSSDVAQIAELAPDLIVVVAYGGLLGRRMLATPACGCVNVHASLLPRWRGAAPIARALAAGDAQTGVSLMRMVRELDAGPVLAQRAIDIDDRATAGELHDRLATLGADLLAAQLGRAPERWTLTEQDDAWATYAPLLQKFEGEIDWRADSRDIDRQIRALSPWPVAYSALDGQNVRIWRARPGRETSDRAPGTIVGANANADGVRVATGRGELEIDELQFAGKRRMSAIDAARGRALEGTRFG